jgi:parvulin-like peptidyl-prolyl isomerase
VDPPRIGYPRARWRLASGSEIERTLLWVSQIVIAHEGSQPDTLLRFGGWTPDPPNPRRTPAEALERANMVLSIAERGEKDFAWLARTYSDDVVTKDHGGSLGGSSATQLPEAYLDVLATLKPGEVSRVFEARAGFAILKRHAPPPDAIVAGRRILIRYKGTLPWPPGTRATRTRAEALALAHEIVNQARSGQTAFADLVSAYSEDSERMPHGDIGAWTLHDPTAFSRQVDCLRTLKVGEVAAPLDTSFGFEILTRTHPETRTRYAMTSIGVLVGLGSDDQKLANARREALILAERVRKDPDQFDALRAASCCSEVRQWNEGQAAFPITHALQQLEIEGIARQPVLAFGFYMIPKRVDPANAPSPLPPMYELPKPDAPDFEGLIRSNQAIQLSEQTRSLSVELRRTLRLPDAKDRELSELTQRLAVSFAKSGDDSEARLQAWRRSLAEVEKLLGPADFARFRSALNEQVARLVIEAT